MSEHFDLDGFARRQDEIRSSFQGAKIDNEFFTIKKKVNRKRRVRRETQEQRKDTCDWIARKAEVELGL